MHKCLQKQDLARVRRDFGGSDFAIHLRFGESLLKPRDVEPKRGSHASLRPEKMIRC